MIKQVAISLLWVQAVLSAPAAGRTLATVNGETVSAAALLRAVEARGQRSDMMLSSPVLRRQYLDQLIDSRLMAKAAEAAGVTNDPVYKELMTAAQTQILAKIYAEGYAAKHLNDAELKSYFERDPSRYSNQEVHVAHIVVRSEAKAKSLLIKLQNGANFTTLAKAESEGPSAPHGGDLGFIGRGRMVPEFEAAMFSTPKGGVFSQPIKTAFGYHLVKVLDTKGNVSVAFADVEDKVRMNYTEELRVQMAAELRAKAQVIVDEEAVKAFALPPKS